MVVQTLDILRNNLGIAIWEIIPGFGWFIFFAATMGTGQTLSALAIASNIPSVFIIITLFLSPHAWVELLAYAVAITESFLIVYSLFGRRLRKEGRRALASLGLMFFLLLFGAILEVVVIDFGIAGFVFAWAMAIVVGIAIFWASRHVSWPRAPGEPSPAPIEAPPAVTSSDPRDVLRKEGLYGVLRATQPAELH